MGNANILVSSTLALCLLPGSHKTVVVSNNGPGIAYLDDQSQVNGNSHDFALGAGDTITWAADTPLWVLAQKGMIASITISQNVTIFGGLRLYTVTNGPAGIGSSTGAPVITHYTDAGISYDVYQFNANGSISFSTPGEIDAVIIGGGGAGGFTNAGGGRSGGGGGAGGYFAGTLQVPAGTFDVIIGAGGPDQSGGSPTFFLMEVPGGGLGGCWSGAVGNGTQGGSSGGGSSGGGLGATYQYRNLGNAGANGVDANLGGGGGGAGGTGSGGTGGLGASSSITGTAVTRAIGGTSQSGLAGAANTGNGGGSVLSGGGYSAGLAGGSGVVIVRVKTG